MTQPEKPVESVRPGPLAPNAHARRQLTGLVGEREYVRTGEPATGGRLVCRRHLALGGQRRRAHRAARLGRFFTLPIAKSAAS